jgi:cardiolipin synthase
MPLNLANSLTLCRIILTPAFIISVLYNEYKTALVIFIMAGATDALDGLIARSMKQKTRFGAMLDPLADKILVISSFIVLSQPDDLLFYKIPLWVTTVIVMREIVILAGVVLIHMVVGRVEIQPTLAGKINTVLLVATIFMVLLCNAMNLNLTLILLILYIATCACTIASGLHYIYFGMRQWGQTSVDHMD